MKSCFYCKYANTEMGDYPCVECHGHSEWAPMNKNSVFVEEKENEVNEADKRMVNMSDEAMFRYGGMANEVKMIFDCFIQAGFPDDKAFTLTNTILAQGMNMIDKPAMIKPQKVPITVCKHCGLEVPKDLSKMYEHTKGMHADLWNYFVDQHYAGPLWLYENFKDK